MLLLIDTRDLPPEPEKRSPHDWSWVPRALAALFPWPAIIAWLFIGSIVLTDLAGMIFAVVTMVVAFWRLSKVYPRWGGLSDYSQ